MRAVVIGADAARNNVGHTTARMLLSTGWDVESPSLHKLNMVESDLHEESWENVELMIVTAGGLRVDHFHAYNAEQVRKQIDDNLTGPLLVANAWISQVIHDGIGKFAGATAGRFVCVGSDAAFLPRRWLAPYCAAKAGLNHAVTCLAREYHPRGFRFFCLNPGKIVGTGLESDMAEGVSRLTGKSAKESERFYESKRIMHRWQSTHDVAKLIRQIATGDLDWLAGNPIHFSGGQIL